MMKARFRRPQRGFTLIEAIIVIVLTGIVSVMAAMFIRVPMKSYIDLTARAELADTADTAVRRIARELHLALPNSVRTVTNSTGSYLELLQTKSGGRYVAVEDDGGASPLQFATGIACGTDPAQCRFQVAGAMPAGRQAIAAGDYIVVYNLGPGMEPANAYADVTNCGAAGCNIARVQSVASATNTVNLTPNASGTSAFAAQPAGTAMVSPQRRFHVVSGPVTYYCDPAAGKLYRYANYPIQAAQPDAAGGGPLTTARQELLADGVESCDFNVSMLTSRAGLVTVRLGLFSRVNGDKLGLFQQVHVDNTP